VLCKSHVVQVELLRAKLDLANSKNDTLRENYEMLDTKLTQTEEKAAADARLIAQLQKEERRLKEELDLTKVQNTFMNVLTLTHFNMSIPSPILICRSKCSSLSPSPRRFKSR
jgi:hypothetical protein